ncbi:MAG: hypothetical protein AB7N71_08920, partial [Phycisphaerae bacterium]
DNVPPVALCRDFTVELDETGHATIAVADVNDGSKDACGLASLTLSQTTFNCCDVGPNNVTLFARDVNNNLSVCTAVVTVVNPFPSISICDLGDMNCDGCLTVSDIGPFVLAITNPAGYAAQFPNCNILHGDTNLDGFVTVGDIGRFVELLVGT